MFEKYIIRKKNMEATDLAGYNTAEELYHGVTTAIYEKEIRNKKLAIQSLDYQKQQVFYDRKKNDKFLSKYNILYLMDAVFNEEGERPSISNNVFLSGSSNISLGIQEFEIKPNLGSFWASYDDIDHFLSSLSTYNSSSDIVNKYLLLLATYNKEPSVI